MCLPLDTQALAYSDLTVSPFLNQTENVQAHRLQILFPIDSRQERHTECSSVLTKDTHSMNRHGTLVGFVPTQNVHPHD